MLLEAILDVFNIDLLKKSMTVSGPQILALSESYGSSIHVQVLERLKVVGLLLLLCVLHLFCVI